MHKNNEQCSRIPGPACTAEHSNVRSSNGKGFVHAYRGFHGIGDVPAGAASLDWRNPILPIKVEKYYAYRGFW